MRCCCLIQSCVEILTLYAVGSTVVAALSAAPNNQRRSQNLGLTAFRPCSPYYELNVVEAVRVYVLGSELLRECLTKFIVLANLPGKFILDRLFRCWCLIAHICSVIPELLQSSGLEILLCAIKTVAFGIRARTPLYSKFIEFMPEDQVYPFFHGVFSCINRTVFKIYRKGDYKAMVFIVGYLQRFLF
jgi:hypothetical protein